MTGNCTARFANDSSHEATSGVQALGTIYQRSSVAREQRGTHVLGEDISEFRIPKDTNNGGKHVPVALRELRNSSLCEIPHPAVSLQWREGVLGSRALSDFRTREIDHSRRLGCEVIQVQLVRWVAIAVALKTSTGSAFAGNPGKLLTRTGPRERRGETNDRVGALNGVEGGGDTTAGGVDCGGSTSSICARSGQWLE